MTLLLSMAEARARLPEALAGGGDGTAAITRRGEPILAVLTREMYEAIPEVLEILGGSEQEASRRRCTQDLAESRTRPPGAVLADPGW